jgi:hypothetical protein
VDSDGQPRPEQARSAPASGHGRTGADTARRYFSNRALACGGISRATVSAVNRAFPATLEARREQCSSAFLAAVRDPSRCERGPRGGDRQPVQYQRVRTAAAGGARGAARAPG